MSNYDYVEVPKPKESGFDLSYPNKFTMDFGDMVPCFSQEVLPGDEFKVNSQFMVRMAPLANPIFTKINAQIHYFFVPNRLLWDGGKDNDWQSFITGGKDGTLTPTPPYMLLSDIASLSKTNTDLNAANDRGAQTLADYLGVPFTPNSDGSIPESWSSIKVNMLPFLAYQKIYDDWFRDANVTNSLFDSYESPWLYGGKIGTSEETSTLPSTLELLKLRKRSWKKDYFTSALPWAQRGEEVHIPVGSKFSVVGSFVNGTQIVNPSSALLIGVNSNTTGVVAQVKAASADGIQLNPLSLGTIRDLRNASALQLWLEKNAVGGARYIEQLLAHFGVYSDDARMQRAEYLGSAKSPIVISEIQQTSETTADSPLGKLGGKGIGYGNDFVFKDTFKEHGWIIGIMTIMPEATYAQGIHRSLTHRMSKLDYAFPEFAELGLQEIDNSEIYLGDGTEATDTFGYNDRYAEYKSNYGQVHGFFKDENETLAQYNMTRFYGTTPELSSNFLEVNESQITSPFVDTDENRGNLWVDLWNDVKAVRPLPKNSLPLF